MNMVCDKKMNKMFEIQKGPLTWGNIKFRLNNSTTLEFFLKVAKHVFLRVFNEVGTFM